MSGFTLAGFLKFRQQHPNYGPVRWLEAVSAGIADARSIATADRRGFVFTEQTVDSDTLAGLWSSDQAYTAEEFGTIAVGTSIASVMPSQIQLEREHVLIYPNRQRRFSCEVKRGNSGLTDALPHSNPIPTATLLAPWNLISSILKVRRGTTVYSANTDYVLSSAGIVWQPAGAHPSAGQTYAVSYLHRPVFRATGHVMNQDVLDANGELLSEWWALEQLTV